MTDSQGHTERLESALAGRYRIEKHIGEGGMATVYQAHDLKHDRKVAVKVLRPELAAVIGGERFLNEIRVTANLQHPHILPLHDSGDADGFLFYVMPYLEDDTLRDKLDREKQFGIEEALEITKGIASALDYAHRQGVIHRDIKPANILMHEGQPMIADFGIALAVSHASDQRLTETGLSIGTPHYMSPEQAMGDRELDPRSDIYSLGAMLYEMLAGEPPYSGSTAQAIVAKVITSKPAPVRETRDTVPLHVDAAIAKSLHKMPADRFSTASAFADALTNPGFTIPTTMVMPAEVPDAAGPSRRTVALTAVGALALLGIGFVGGRSGASEAAAPVARFVVSAPEGVTAYSRCCGPVQALSPDGEWLVFAGVGGGDGRSPLYRRRLGQLEAEEIPGTDNGTIPFFSPDGRWLGFHADGRLRKVPMTGGPPVPIAEIPRVDGASWGDNDVIVLTLLDASYTVPGAGGVPTPVPGTEGRNYLVPSMLPGGEAAVMRIGGTPPSEARMVAVDLATGAADTLGFGTRVAYASGHIVFSGADGTLLAQPFDAKRRRTTGQSVAILDGMRLAGPSIGEFALSAQGALAYQGGSGGGQETLVITGPSGPTEVQLPEGGNLEDPAFSPDGRRIALRLVDAGQTQDIWIWDRDQETLERLTVEGSVNAAPVWTKDGERVAYTSLRDDGQYQIYWQPSDGSGSAEPLLRTEYRAAPGSWSPDGRTLAFRADRVGNWDVGLITLGDSLPLWRLESEFNELQPEWSPDGTWLAYTSDRSGAQEVYVEAIDGEGGRFQVSTNGAHSPRWAPDGSVLYYADLTGAITAASFSTESGFRVTERAQRFNVDDLNATSSVNYDVHPDGEEFVHISFGGLQGDLGIVWILNWPEIVREMTSGG